MDFSSLQKLARLIRYYILISTTAAESGHASSSLSAVELATTLFFKHFRADLDGPTNLSSDRFILSKGHASPLLYALYGAAGKISEEELKQLRSFESVLEGHPSMRFPFTEVPTGSLGQGLSVGAGEALALRARISNFKFQISNYPKNAVIDSSKRYTLDAIPYVYVLLGDGEMAEGQNWEAIQIAAYYKLNNLVALIDVNRLGQSGQTMYGADPQAYAKRIAAFGWRTYVLENGHDMGLVDKAFSLVLEQSKTSQMPAAIIAKTVKGKGVSFFEDRAGFHGIPLKPEELGKALEELREVDKSVRGIIQKPETSVQRLAYSVQKSESVSFTQYKSDEKVATRKAYGTGLVRLGKMYENVVALDGEVKNSTYSELFAKAYPDRFFEMFIAEQNMVSAALGMAKLGLVPYASSFGCFLMRAADQIRIADLSGLHLVLCGSHAGVSIGEDGPSQMALSDLSLFRSLISSTVLYPSDGVMTEKLVEEAYKTQGIVYIRTTRPATPVLYKADETFPIGGSKVFYSSSDPHANRDIMSFPRKRESIEMDLRVKPEDDKVSSQHRDVPSGTSLRSNNKELTIVAAGITVFEALKAAELLKRQDIAVRVIDCYSIKPIDAVTLQKAARETKAIITVEDHFTTGGLGDAVLDVLAGESHVPVYKLGVTKPPRSGKSEELMVFEEIDSAAIVKKVKSVYKNTSKGT